MRGYRRTVMFVDNGGRSERPPAALLPKGPSSNNPRNSGIAASDQVGRH